MRLAVFAAALAASAAARAERRVVMVADSSADGVALETRLGHSPDVTLISRGSQLEILRGLKLGANAKLTDALAQKLGRLAGADAVLWFTGDKAKRALRWCRAAACEDLPTSDAPADAAVLSALGAAAPGPRATDWPDETKSAAALAAYAEWRAGVSVAVEQAAVKGRESKTKGLDAPCKKALLADAAYAPAKAGLAAARALAGDANGEHDLREALILLPTDPLPAAALVHLLVEKDRVREALDALKAAEKEAPNSLDLKRLRAERLFAMDMFADAQPAFEGALALAPKSPYLNWRLSYTLHMQSQDAKALEHAQAASEQSGGTHPFYQEEYASRLIDVGRFADAKAVLEPLRKDDPKWGRVALRLGWCLLRLGDAKAALPLFAEAAAAKPRDKREGEDAALARLDLARADAKLGDAAAAFKELDALKAAGKLNAVDLKDPDLDALRADPRFGKLGH